MAIHTRLITITNPDGTKDRVHGLVDDNGRPVMRLTGDPIIGRQGNFKTLTPKKRRKAPLKGAPDNVVGRVAFDPSSWRQ